MRHGLFGFGTWTERAALAVVASTALVAGATWRGLAADSRAGSSTAAAQTATIQQPAMSHAVAGGRDSYADVVKVAGPSVVTIRTEGKARVSPTGFDDTEDFFRRFFGDESGAPQRFGRGQPPRAPRQRALGSGVIVSQDGYIVTNNHVIDLADDIRVELTDGRSLRGKVVGTDGPTDLAVLKVETTDLHPIALGNSDAVQVGDVVLAVGNPMGLGQTVTMGIVSAKGRHTDVGDGSYEDFLQTDAPINHGNSGGALVNMKGELVGINSQILSTSDGNIGIGFAIPANMAKHVMTDLKTSGHVKRSQLGVTIQPVTSEMAESLGLKQVGGAIVSSVQSGSAAERGGIRRGDVILSFNGDPVQDINSLRNHVADSAPGSTSAVVIVRDGSERTLHVTLDAREDSKTAARRGDGDRSDNAALGVSVAPLTPETAARAGVPKDVHGVIVQDVNPDSRAADAGIQAGDVIQEVNREPVKGVDDLRAAVKKSADRPVLLLVNRQGKDLFVTVRPS